MTLRADKGTWEERARARLSFWLENWGLSSPQRGAMEALLAEPAEPAYKPGDEIPGWVAAKLASEGRAEEVEWESETMKGVWMQLSVGAPHRTAFMNAYPGRFRFRLRPAPTQPEPTPREAFEEALSQLGTQHEDRDGFADWINARSLRAALRALADEVAYLRESVDILRPLGNEDVP